ncbi:MAG: hypothetical protein WDW19_01045 [Neisseriaceae bacterium]
MKKLVVVSLTIFSMGYVLAGYTFTYEDKKCAEAGANSDVNLTRCFDDISNKMDAVITEKIAGDKKKLAQYNKELNKLLKRCGDRYRDEDGKLPRYSLARASQCTYLGIETIGKKYGVRF